MTKIPNHKAREFVQLKAPFRGSNLYADNVSNSYVVYSYGEHHPLYVYNFTHQQWYANTDKYSRTTTKHAGQAHPHDPNMLYGTTMILDRIIRYDDATGAVPSWHKPKLTKSRDPNRETIEVLKENERCNIALEDNWRLPTRTHYLDTLPRYLQHKVALIKLSPPGAYIDGIGGRNEQGQIILNTSKPTS